MGTIIVPGSLNDRDTLRESKDAQRLALTTHSTDGLGLRLVPNSEPSPRRLWEGWRPALSAREPGGSGAGREPGPPPGKPQVPACASGRWGQSGVSGSVPWSEPRYGTLPRPSPSRGPPRASTPHRAAPGVSVAPRGCSDPSLASAQPRPAAAVSLPPLPAPRSDSPAPAPRKVWWRGGRGGQAAWCSAAAAAGAPKERTGEAGRRGRSRAGGGQRGGRRRPAPPPSARPGLPRRAPRAASRREGAPGGGASGADTSTARPGSEQLCTPAWALPGGEAPWVCRERQREGQSVCENEGHADRSR